MKIMNSGPDLRYKHSHPGEGGMNNNNPLQSSQPHLLPKVVIKRGNSQLMGGMSRQLMQIEAPLPQGFLFLEA